MKYRPLGDTGLEVSEIGFGAWGIGGVEKGPAAYGPTNDQESRAALRRAYELGVTFYDTADFYGDGHSESLIGETLVDVRDSVIIATKAGFSDGHGTQDFSPDYIRRSLEGSLKRLRTDYVDLFQLHSPPIARLQEDDRLIRLLDSLKTQGKIRAFGVSAAGPDDALVAITEFGFKAVQVNFSLVDQRALRNGLFDLCRERGVGIITRTPLSFGFLTGAYPPDGEFSPGDHRGSWSSEQRERWATAGPLFGAVLMKEQGSTYAQAALNYCLSYESVSTVIPGMLTVDHVEENVVAGQMARFSTEELLQAEEIYRDNVFYLGR